MRGLGGAAAALTAALVLTACGSQAPRSTYTPTVTVAPSVAPTDPSVPPATPEPSASDPGRPAGQCPDDALGVVLRRAAGDDTAGSRSYEVLFTNTGGEACELRGTPGVAVIDADGTRLGRSAERVLRGARTVEVDVGENLVAPLQVTAIGTDGGSLGSACRVVRGAGYRVAPPHATRTFRVSDGDALACADGPVFMTVGPVRRE